MDHKREKRIRRLVRKANANRRKQAQQIDILCNDFIGSQKEFVNSLSVINFAANFYESIIGISDLNTLLYSAGKFIKEEIADVHLTFFLRDGESFDFHIMESDKPISIDKGSFEDCFTDELVSSVCKSNKVCSLDDLVSMGLCGNPKHLNNVSVSTVPLSLLGASLGFILVYRSSENKLACIELENLTAIVPGLYRAIQSCQSLLHSSSPS